MRLVRFLFDGAIRYGSAHGDRIDVIDGDPFGTYALGDSVSREAVRLLAPVMPRQILGVGLNYRSHLQGRPEPAKPELFWKPPSAVIGPTERILLPRDAEDVHAEGELVIVIGCTAHDLTPAEAQGAVYGYTIGNDVSERVWQRDDRQWWRAKGADTFAPLGPEIVTGLDWRTGPLETRINDTLVQAGDLSDLIFDVPTVIAFASRYVTLQAGDLIFTGTPGRTATLRPGDRVAVRIGGIGELINAVAALP